MKRYDLNTELTFGKFKGNKVKDIITFHPYYIEWCALNMEHFYVEKRVIVKIKELFPNYEFSTKAIEVNEKKIDDYLENQRIISEDSDFVQQCKEDSFYALSGGQYDD